MDTQTEFFTSTRHTDSASVSRLIEFLRGRNWTTCTDILHAHGQPASEQNKRWVRSLAEASEGEIGSGQLGYKLVAEMTNAEFQHFRNWMKSQSDKMTRRVLLCDKVFFRRQEVRTGNGILEAAPL